MRPLKGKIYEIYIYSVLFCFNYKFVHLTYYVLFHITIVTIFVISNLKLNLNIKLMPKIKTIPVLLTLRITSEVGCQESVTGRARDMRERFASLVNAYCNHYYGAVTIELIDNRNCVWKSFKQSY